MSGCLQLGSRNKTRAKTAEKAVFFWLYLIISA
ncbi:MAG: hypothetical protein K0Q59_1899 [Paenibacillus sp.]|nr:hypothetical protein [Paenibacillus sp.]